MRQDNVYSMKKYLFIYSRKCNVNKILNEIECLVGYHRLMVREQLTMTLNI